MGGPKIACLLPYLVYRMSVAGNEKNGRGDGDDDDAENVNVNSLSLQNDMTDLATGNRCDVRLMTSHHHHQFISETQQDKKTQQ